MTQWDRTQRTAPTRQRSRQQDARPGQSCKPHPDRVSALCPRGACSSAEEQGRLRTGKGAEKRPKEHTRPPVPGKALSTPGSRRPKPQPQRACQEGHRGQATPQVLAGRGGAAGGDVKGAATTGTKIRTEPYGPRSRSGNMSKGNKTCISKKQPRPCSLQPASQEPRHGSARAARQTGRRCGPCQGALRSLREADAATGGNTAGQGGRDAKETADPERKPPQDATALRQPAEPTDTAARWLRGQGGAGARGLGQSAHSRGAGEQARPGPQVQQDNDS